MTLRPSVGLDRAVVSSVLAAALILSLSSTTFADKKKIELPAPPAPISDADREAMQMRVYNVESAELFEAIQAVLKFDGWTVTEKDDTTHQIHAESLKTQSGVGPDKDWILNANQKTQPKLLTKPERRYWRLKAWTRWLEMSASVEPRKDSSTRIRVSIIKTGLPPSSTRTKASVAPFSVNVNEVRNRDDRIGVPFDDAAVYQQFFEKLDRRLALEIGDPPK